MPTVTETDTTGYAHCRNAMCAGYMQQQVPATREESTWTFGELGGDGVFTHMPERSMITLLFVNDGTDGKPDDRPCPACGEPREVTADPRPSYQPLSGHDPMGLLNAPRFNAAAQFDMGAGAGPGESDEAIEQRIRARVREEQIEARVREEMGG